MSIKSKIPGITFPPYTVQLDHELFEEIIGQILKQMDENTNQEEIIINIISPTYNINGCLNNYTLKFKLMNINEIFNNKTSHIKF